MPFGVSGIFDGIVQPLELLATKTQVKGLLHTHDDEEDHDEEQDGELLPHGVKKPDNSLDVVLLPGLPDTLELIEVDGHSTSDPVSQLSVMDGCRLPTLTFAAKDAYGNLASPAEGRKASIKTGFLFPIDPARGQTRILV